MRNFIRWWEGLLEADTRGKGQKHIALNANTLWQIWKARNSKMFTDKCTDCRLIVQKAHHGWLKFIEAKDDTERKHTAETSQN